MALDVDVVKDRFSRALKGFSPAQLVIIGLLSALGVTGVVFFMKWVSAPTYGVLLAGLDPKDAAAVTAKLQSDGVAYKLSSGGTTVLVPQGSLDKERLSIAAAGLPAGSTSNSWAAFDKQGLTSSSFQQQVAYQRALESTLADSLQQIDGIRGAQVHLALSQQRLFTQDQQPARASVLVQTDGTPSSDTVDAMTHLIASAVPDLDPKDVSITDGSGTLLTGGTDTGGSKLLQARNAYEDQLSAQVTSMFDTLLGPGHAVVRVNAEMDNASTTVDRQVYDPKKTVPLTLSTSTEKYAPGSGPGTSTSGTLSSTPSAATTTSTTGNGYTKTDTQSTNGVSVETSHSVVAPGGVKRLTVAVAVDSHAKNLPTMSEIQSMVGNAVGLDPARGDTISVASPAFASTGSTAKKAAAASSSPVSSLTSHAPQVVGGVVLLLVGLGLLRSVRRGSATEVPMEQITAAVEARRRAELAGGSTPLGLPPGSIPAPRAEGDLAGALDGSPDEVAGLLRGWLASTGSQS